jgi:2-polyprenyl-6-methoxyphenol hydroxylase-like FAD-dependent oxidoreductase
MSRTSVIPADFDAVVVGASLAGSAAAMLLGRSGVRVALVEKQSHPEAFKRTCSHFVQASAVPTLERLGLIDELHTAGAVRSRMRMWTRWGWILPSPTARCRPRSTCAARGSTRCCGARPPRRPASSCCSARARTGCCTTTAAG